MATEYKDRVSVRKEISDVMNRLLKCLATFATITNAEKRRSGKRLCTSMREKLKRPRKRKGLGRLITALWTALFFNEVNRGAWA